MDVSIRSASIQLNALDNAIVLSITGQTAKMNQPTVDYRGGMTTTRFGSRSFTVDLAPGSNEFFMNVIWNYKGSYGGHSLDVIECGGSITLDNGPEPTPTPEPEPEPTPTPEPVYASMAGIVHDIEAARYTIELANGQTVTVDPEICRLAYGLLAEGCSCTVFYTDEPSEESIYQVDIYGVTEGFDPDAGGEKT